MLRALASAVGYSSDAVSDNETSAWIESWLRLKAEAIEQANVATGNRQNEAIREFFRAIRGKEMDVHVANSLSVRMALKYADRYLYVNRGVNGIEGSLSTAAGFSIMSACPVACIIGDLSFFYDALLISPVRVAILTFFDGDCGAMGDRSGGCAAMRKLDLGS